MAEQLHSETFDAYIQSSTQPVLVDFFRDGCLPCRRIAPLVSKAETEYAGKLAFARVNITTNPDLAAKQEVEAAPTLVLYRNGAEIARHRGAIKKAELTALIEAHL